MPLSKNIVKLTNFSVNSMIFKPFVHIKLETVYLVNYVEILLHDHFSGYIEIANPLGSFSSLGASPLGIGNFNASLEMIVQYYNSNQNEINDIYKIAGAEMRFEFLN